LLPLKIINDDSESHYKYYLNLKYFSKNWDTWCRLYIIIKIDILQFMYSFVCINWTMSSSRSVVIYRLSSNKRITPCMQIGQIKLNRKILYRFALFAIINKKLINKDQSIHANIIVKRDNLLVTRHIMKRWVERFSYDNNYIQLCWILES